MAREVVLFFAYGTRPEAIKIAPVILESRRRESVRCLVCVTGQHRDLLDEANAVFDIHPDIDLALMREGQSLPSFLSAAVTPLAQVVARERPDVVVVQGDTTSALSAALAAFWERVPIAHVEAGLRTHNPRTPFPEEMHRVLIDRMASWHFAPTELARENLLAEGVVSSSIEITGNTAIDALYMVEPRAPAASVALAAVGIPPDCGRIVLVTAHRRENHGQPLDSICTVVRALVETRPDVCVVYVAHPHPEVGCRVTRMLAGHPRIHVVRPLRYDHLIAVLKKCWFVLTDSGGLQEEASALGVPLLILRDETERVEALTNGGAILVGCSYQRVVENIERMESHPPDVRPALKGTSVFGDGRAAKRIVDRVLRDVRAATVDLSA